MENMNLFHHKVSVNKRNIEYLGEQHVAKNGLRQTVG